MRRVKTDDSYEDGSREASKTTTGTRMANPKGSIPVTVGTFEAWGVGGGGLANREPRTYMVSGSRSELGNVGGQYSAIFLRFVAFCSS